MRIRGNLVSASNSSSNDVASTCSDPPSSSNPVVLVVIPRRRCSSATAASASLVCVLNVSPWDVADPSCSQLDGGLFSLTGTSSAVPEPSNAAPLSVASSVKLSGDNRKQLIRANGGADSDSGEEERREKGAGLKLSPGKIRASSSSGVILSSRIRSSNSQLCVKKQQEQQQSNAQPVPKRRGRPVKHKPATNPYEFYYYSGFGPHWGKKRGSAASEPGANVVGAEAPSEGGGGGIEFVEYEDEDDEDEEEEGRRRGGGRKRVKARSLKSLM